MRPLSDLLPLRDTSVWPGYDHIAVIPRVYDRARVKPLRYNEAGTLYVLADHSLLGVDAVTVGGQPVTGWRWRNDADMTGHAVAFLELASAPDSSATLLADVRGLSGNPADIIEDIYYRADLQDFRIYCRNQNLLLAGALDNKMTIRAAIQFVLEQVGAVWSAGLPGFAKSFPPASDAPIQAEIGSLSMSHWSAACGLESIKTRLLVSFDQDQDGKPQQSLVLEAPTAMRVHGEREAELALPWVRDAHQALATAITHLQWYARPLWTLQLSVDQRYRSIMPGGWICVTHPRLPLSGLYVVTDLDPGYGRGSVSLTVQAPAGDPPPIQLIRQSAIFAPIRTDYVINPQADVAVLTITDAASKKLPGARVWIDGKGPLTADAEAKIQFTAAPGVHVIRIEADGMTAITTSITL